MVRNRSSRKIPGVCKAARGPPATAQKMSETLSKLRIEVPAEQLEHLFTEDAVADMLDFFCNTITEANYIPESMRKACSSLEMVDATEAKKEVEEKFPCVFDITDQDVEDLETELRNKELLLEELENLLEESRENNQNIDHEILNLEEAQNKLAIDLNSAIEDCEKTALEADNLQAILKQRNLTTREEYDLLPSGNFAAPFFKNAELISTTLYGLIKTRSSTDQPMFSINDPYSANALFKSTFGSLRSGIHSQCQKKILLHMEQEYFNAKFEALRSNRFLLPEHQLAEEVAKAEAIETGAQLQLQRTVEQISIIESEQMLSQFLDKYYSVNLNNTLLIKEKILALKEETKLFWTQNLFFSTFQDFINQMSGNLQARSSKIVNLNEEANLSLGNSMREINEVVQEYENIQTADSETTLMQNHFFQFCCKLMNCDSFKSLLTKFSNQQIELKDLKQRLFHTSLERFQELIQPTRKELAAIHDKLYKSQVYKLQTLDVAIVDFIHQLKSMLEQSSEKCNQFSKELKSKMTETISLNDSDVCERMLWVFFLVEPKKMLKILNKSHV